MEGMPNPPDREDSLTQSQSATSPLLSIRTALILLTSLVTGGAVGGLSLLCGIHAAGAVLAGLTSAGVTIPTLHSLIE